MEPIPIPLYLSGTPNTIIEDIEFSITAFNHWATSPGNRKDELPKWKARIEANILLATHSEMKQVWKKVKGLERPYSDQEFDLSVHNFYVAIQSALYGQSSWGELPPQKRLAKHDEIIRTMHQLAKDIQHYDLDQLDIVEHEGKPCPGCWVRSEDGKPAEFTTFQNVYINQTGIQISQLLIKHAFKLEQQRRHNAPLTQQTKGHDKDLLHFIRSLAIYNTSRYGKAHASIISRLASIYFPTLDTEPPKVRASIRALNLTKTHTKHH